MARTHCRLPGLGASLPGQQSIRDQVQQDAGDLLGKSLHLTSGGIKRSLQRNLETLLFGAGSMVGKIEAFLDDRIDVDRPTFAGAFARMQQHVLNDRVRALAVLHDLFEVVAKDIGQFRDFFTRFLVGRQPSERFLQLVDQLNGKPGKVIDEIERVLDFVGDAGGKLTQGRKLLRLNEAVLCGSQILKRSAQFTRALLLRLEQPRVFSIAIAAWSAKVSTSSICCGVNGRGLERPKTKAPTATPSHVRGTPRRVRNLPTFCPSVYSYSGSARTSAI